MSNCKNDEVVSNSFAELEVFLFHVSNINDLCKKVAGFF